MSEHRVVVLRDSDLRLFGAECCCGWKSDHLHTDRVWAENDRLEHETAADHHGDER